MFTGVCLSTGRVPSPGGWGAWSQRGAWSRGCLLETPPDGYCCGRYASYWNEFLLVYKYSLSRPSSKVQFAQIEAYFFSIVALDWHVKHCILKCLQGSRDNDKRCVSKYKFVIEIFQATKEWEWKSMSSIWKLLFRYQMIKINTGLVRPRWVCCCWTNWFIFGQSDGRHVLIKLSSLSSQFKVISHVAFAVVDNIVSMLMRTQMQRKGFERYHGHNVKLVDATVTYHQGLWLAHTDENWSWNRYRDKRESTVPCRNVHTSPTQKRGPRPIFFLLCQSGYPYSFPSCSGEVWPALLRSRADSALIPARNLRIFEVACTKHWYYTCLWIIILSRMGNSRYQVFQMVFSCASAKAERSLSSLSCVWM